MSRRISVTSRPRRLRSLLVALLRVKRGAAAIEFAFVAPVLFVLTLGSLEVALALYGYHTAGEATRRAARDFIIQLPVTSLDVLPVECPGAATCNSARIDTVVTAMQALVPGLTSENLRVSLDESALDTGPSGVVTAVVTVRVTGLQYRFAIFGALLPGLPASLTYPAFATSQVASTEVL